MNNRPSVQDAAKEILRVAVHEMQVKPDHPIDAAPVIAAFGNLPWRTSDLQAALVIAQQLGWVTEDGRLTAAGFAAAPLR